MGEQMKQVLPGKTPVDSGKSGERRFALGRVADARPVPIHIEQFRTGGFICDAAAADGSFETSYGSSDGNLSCRMNTTTIRLPPQSSLKNLSALGQGPNLATCNGGAVNSSDRNNNTVRSVKQPRLRPVERPAGAIRKPGRQCGDEFFESGVPALFTTKSFWICSTPGSR